MRHAVAACLCLMTVFSIAPVRAESKHAFVERVRAAFGAADKAAALKLLFYLANVDSETVRSYESRIIGRMFAKYDNPEITLEPLAKDFYPLQVIGAFEYRPNLKPIGYVVFAARTKVPYGEHDGRYFFTAMTRTRITPAPPPDRMLQMMVIGIGHPPVRYEGHCDIMQGNGQIRRMTLEDQGRGGNTAIITAQFIVGCELINKSGRGALSLRLQEGEVVTFKRRVVAPDAAITYRRPVPKPR